MFGMRDIERRLPVGADVVPDGVHFRVWAPNCDTVEVVLEGPDSGTFPLRREVEGYFAALVTDASAGSRYRYRLDDDDTLVPDPASRFQPDGLTGPSQVVDPSAFAWTDIGWRGVDLPGRIIYEMHIGTFTPEGTWAAASERLPELADLGVSLLELMPVASFQGRFNWGYDGVLQFAPTASYGTCDDFRRFVDRAHALGLGVVLDVVYNHLGPGWEFLKRLSEDYVSKRHRTEWGETFNFDEANSGPVRELVIANGAFWAAEYHLDGLRIDATQQIFDDSPRHVLCDLCEGMRAAAGDRHIVLIGENEPQRAGLLRSGTGGPHLDALWNEDFHHSARVALTGRSDGYLSMHRGAPQELISASKWGWLYQGQMYPWQGKSRGTPTFGLEIARLINYLENHDQVANTGDGRRLHQQASPGRFRAITAWFLLIPGTPMLFQGQEYGATTPFLFFADFSGELGRSYHEGRRKFAAQFLNLATPEMQAVIPDPTDPETFRRCKLDWGERTRGAAMLALHRDLLRLRREDSVFRCQNAGRIHGAVLGAEAFLLRFFGKAGDDRLLVVNLGPNLVIAAPAEPLLAPPRGRRWQVAWHSEQPRYGGVGIGAPDTDQGWLLPGHAAFVCAPEAGNGQRGLNGVAPPLR